MRTWACFKKTLLENIRDWKILILILVFAPFFVYLFRFYFSSSAQSGFTVAVLNLDGETVFSGDLIREWTRLAPDGNQRILNVIAVHDPETAKKMIRDRTADLFITIPAEFSTSFTRYLSERKGTLAALKSYGDRTNPKCLMAASFTDYAAYSFVGTRTGMETPVAVDFESAGSKDGVREFDLYVPALLVLSLIMILFSAGASIVREIEKGTIVRLAISRLSTFEFLAGLCLNQLLIGIASLIVTLLAALSVGYRINGPIPLLLLTGTLTCFSVIGISIIVSCFVKNMFGLTRGDYGPISRPYSALHPVSRISSTVFSTRGFTPLTFFSESLVSATVPFSRDRL
jgi:ABC-2 type transport system permease protein